jgi:hypothetical protein
MTKRDVITLASKILGFVTVVNIAWFIPQAFLTVVFVSEENVEGSALGALLAVAVGIALYGYIAWFLIWRADRIASWLYPEEEPQAAVIGLDKEILLQVALIAIGVFLVSHALTAFPSVVLLIRLRPHYSEANAWAEFLRFVLQFAIGLYLALGTRGIMRAIEYLRTK